MTTVSIAPTPSQWASAALHLERREDWRFVHIDGTRYAVLTSGSSGRVYQVRADAAGCSCPWYLKTGQRCSHMLGLELAALEAELSEPQPAPAPRARYEDLFHACAAGCGDLVERKGQSCHACGSERDYQARLEAKREAPRPFVNGRIDCSDIFQLNPLAE
jgi:hypothetical protein